MIRCLALTFALSAAMLVPANHNGSTAGKTATRAVHTRQVATTMQRTVARSGYIIASS